MHLKNTLWSYTLTLDTLSLYCKNISNWQHFVSSFKKNSQLLCTLLSGYIHSKIILTWPFLSNLPLTHFNKIELPHKLLSALKSPQKSGKPCYLFRELFKVPPHVLDFAQLIKQRQPPFKRYFSYFFVIFSKGHFTKVVLYQGGGLKKLFGVFYWRWNAQIQKIRVFWKLQSLAILKLSTI